MISIISIDALQHKPLDKNHQDRDPLYQNIIEEDGLYFEDYLRHESCSQCGHDYRFKPSIKDVQTSIDHASELIALFFNGGSR
jgi:Zn ribbon nucleic-acid-binding protein